MSCAEQRLVEFVGAGEIEGKYWDRLIIVADLHQLYARHRSQCGLATFGAFAATPPQRMIAPAAQHRQALGKHLAAKRALHRSVCALRRAGGSER